MPSQIVAVRGPLVGQRFALGDAPLTFGRSAENAVVVASPRASRRHAEIRREAGGFALYDLGSSNGTLVNNQPVQSRLLQPGDLIIIGDEAFRYEVQGAVVQPLPPVQQPLPPVQQPLPPVQQPLPPATARRRPRPWLLLLFGGLFVCVALASSVGGFVLLTAGRGNDAPVAISTAIATAPVALAATSAPSALSTPVPVAPEPTRVLPSDAADWTVLVYLDGDNDLEPDAIRDFEEMARVGSSDRLNIIVQFDRIASAERWDDTSYGNWDSVKRFRIERDQAPTAQNQIADLGELNMGDPRTLSDFIEWGITTYPARRYALIIWDHGASWPGIASDDTSGGDALTLPELSAALATAQQRTGFGKLDLIGFDACLMAQIDVFQAVAPYALVAVASAELEPNDGWAWDAWLARLAADPDQSAFDIAPVIVETYMESFSGNWARTITLSAFDLSRFDDLTARLDTLSAALIADLRGSYRAIGQARSFVGVYAPAYSEEFNAVDLGHFAQLLSEQGAGPAVSAAAQSLFAAITQARIANGFGDYHSNSSGLSIYFPQVADLYVSFYEQNSPLPRQTRWDDFLKAYYRAGETAIIRPTIANLALSSPAASLSAPVTLNGNVAGSDIAYVFAFIGIPNANRDTVQLLYVDYIYPPGSSAATAPAAWPEAATGLRLTWDASRWQLSNGRDQIGALLGPIKYGSDFYGVEGVYTSQATGQQIDAGLVFEVTDGQGVLSRIWGFPRGDGAQEPQPYELRPTAGDTFTAYLRTYTDAGDRLDPGRVEGETITFGDEPLRAFFGPAQAGDYVMGFLVRDIAGQFSYDYVDVAVNAGRSQAPNAP